MIVSLRARTCACVSMSSKFSLRVSFFDFLLLCSVCHITNSNIDFILLNLCLNFTYSYERKKIISSILTLFEFLFSGTINQLSSAKFNEILFVVHNLWIYSAVEILEMLLHALLCLSRFLINFQKFIGLHKVFFHWNSQFVWIWYCDLLLSELQSTA